MSLPSQLVVDMSRCKLQGERSRRYMLNFEHNRGFTTKMLEEISKYLESKNCHMFVDWIRFIIRGGVRTRLYTFDLDTMTSAIALLKETIPSLSITYRGKLTK